MKEKNVKKQITYIRRKWHGVRTKEGFQRAMLFISFVLVSSLFWLILSLNDNMTHSVDVSIKVDNVPDSVTFINDLPANVHVTVKDKGTNLVRIAMLNQLHMNFNFRDFANNGVFAVSRQDFSQSLKSLFGNSAQITSTSLDSLYTFYTTGKGRRVPIVVNADITASPGYMIAGLSVPTQKSVLVYSHTPMADTIMRVYTKPIVRRNLSETIEVDVELRKIPDVRFEPEKIHVVIPVEPLVKKESVVPISVEKVPEGKNLLLFPNNVRVVYYIPMSLYNSDLVPLEVSVDYNDVGRYVGNNLPLRLSAVEDYVEGVKVLADSVEYTVQNN